ncbi:Crossover junction endonuclease mus81 [Malassezia cuniculi]|uniref:Crossover junction endonuclease MUS81 n=1 Tax=Malassezia cuniculi TaxID=948313 RepID=A0AAF0J6Q4_9BASI|nr:Crossover junction endonuclease mus81 [Malassezia cuniculi]
MATQHKEIWLGFLQRWAEDARARGAKSATAFLKAHRALSQHDGALTHPCETVALPAIGAGIASRLETAYAKWCRENGVEMPARPEGASQASSSQAASRPPKRRRVREYIPAPRSGAHGILVGLYIKAGNADAPGASKPELISLAQPFCDSDYSIPGGSAGADVRSLALRQGAPGARARSYITAWNSIKTLIDKEYVYKTGNPPIYTLSEQGLAVAKVLAEAEGVAEADAGAAEYASSASETQVQQQSQPPHTSQPQRSSQPLLHPPPQPSSQLPQTLIPQLSMPRRSFDSDDELEPAVVIDLVATSDDENTYMATRHDTVDLTTPAKHPISISLIDSSPIISPSRSSPAMQRAAAAVHTPPRWAPDRTITLDAGTYDIVLVIDHREVRQRPEGGERVTFEDAMAQRNIPCELRALELGDVLWVAKPRSGLSDTQKRLWQKTGDIVLDVVVERKRLDDLTSSIIDGRWHDQKKRLRHSGIGTVFYVIEDVDVDNLVRRYGQQIQTALSSTQVIDGFFLHRTANTQGTASFFADMHRAVVEMYRDRPLRVLPDAAIQRESFETVQREMRATGGAVHTSFNAFQSLNGRASGTLGDLWMSMLLCIEGMHSHVLPLAHDSHATQSTRT